MEPLDPGDVLAKTAYVLANPVAAGLVRYAAEWPGLWTSPAQIEGAKLTAHKPKRFFDPSGYLPDTVELDLTVPPGFASASDFRAQLSAALAKLEEEHQQKLAREGRRVLGVARARVLAQSPFAKPPAGEPRFGLKPRIAARDKWRRIEALSRLKSFVSEYRHALAEWRSGARAAIFPAGTYLLRVIHDVQCAGAA